MHYQTSFAELERNHKKLLPRREAFLNEMEQTVPWSKLMALIDPTYPTTGRRGRQPVLLARRVNQFLIFSNFSVSIASL